MSTEVEVAFKEAAFGVGAVRWLEARLSMDPRP